MSVKSEEALEFMGKVVVIKRWEWFGNKRESNNLAEKLLG